MTASAGIALCRTPEDEPEILIVHPGGPLWAGKDLHAWSIPKGEFDPESEAPGVAARREFTEELGLAPPPGPALALPSFRAGRKTIWSWLVIVTAEEAPAFAPTSHPTGESFEVSGNLFDLEWPPRSGRHQQFPEVDRAQWAPVASLADRLHKGQRPLVAAITNGLRTWCREPASFTPW